MTIQGAGGNGVMPVSMEGLETQRLRPYRHHLADGTGVPGVTDILADLLPSWMPAQRYLDRGRVVHAAVVLALAGRLKWDGWHPELHGYVKSALRWVEQEHINPFVTEEAVVSEALRYGATLDLRGPYHRGVLIADWKLNQVPAWGNLQTAGQAIAIDEPTARRACVALHEDGSTATPTWYENPADLSDFMTLLGAFHLRRAHEIPISDRV